MPELAAVETQLVEIPAHDGLKIPINVYLPAGAARKEASRDRQLPRRALRRVGRALGSHRAVLPRSRLRVGRAQRARLGRLRSRLRNGGQRGQARPKRSRTSKPPGRWVGAQPWADKNKLIVYGGSYGGYTTLIGLTRQADLWRAGVDLFGVANLPTFLKTTSGAIRDLFKTEFGDLEKDAALLDEQSPLRQVGQDRRSALRLRGRQRPARARSPSPTSS